METKLTLRNWLNFEIQAKAQMWVQVEFHNTVNLKHNFHIQIVI